VLTITVRKTDKTEEPAVIVPANAAVAADVRPTLRETTPLLGAATEDLHLRWMTPIAKKLLHMNSNNLILFP